MRLSCAMTKSLDLDAIDKVLEKWNWAKKEEEVMKKKIEECKTQVEKHMMQSN